MPMASTIITAMIIASIQRLAARVWMAEAALIAAPSGATAIAGSR